MAKISKIYAIFKKVKLSISYFSNKYLKKLTNQLLNFYLIIVLKRIESIILGDK